MNREDLRDDEGFWAFIIIMLIFLGGATYFVHIIIPRWAEESSRQIMVQPADSTATQMSHNLP